MLDQDKYAGIQPAPDLPSCSILDTAFDHRRAPSMTPERLVQAVSSALFKNLPPGVSRAYLRAFLRRNQASLLTAIRQQFERMCRPNLLIPGFETPVGDAVLPVERSAQLAAFGKDIGSSPIVRLVVKARCHPSDPKQLREFAVHSRRDDEQTWRVHPGESWHGTEDDAIRAFARAHALDARWFDHAAEIWVGPDDAPYILTDEVAAETAAEVVEETPADVAEVRSEARRSEAREVKGKHEAGDRQHQKAQEPREGARDRARAVPDDSASTSTSRIGNQPVGTSAAILAQGNQPVPAPASVPVSAALPVGASATMLVQGNQPVPTSASMPVSAVQPVPISSSTSTRPSPNGTTPVETPWGGLRSSSPLDPESISQNRRVVTKAGLHGTVRKVLVYSFTTSRLAFSGAGVQPSEPTREKRLEFTVHLDSGRTIDTEETLYEELARPTRVVPDLSFDDGNHWLSPEQAWREVLRSHNAIGYYRKKAQDSRKRQNRDQYTGAAERSRLEFEAQMQTFTDWRQAHHKVAIDGLDPLVERKLQLEGQVKGTGRRMFGPGYRDEVQWLNTAPSDWRTRFRPGDRVIVPDFYEDRRLETHPDTVERVEGDRAFLASGASPVLLYYLRLDDSVPSQVPAYTEPRYLVSLAGDLLAPTAGADGTPRTSSVERAVFARAVKAFLADQGIPVRTEVERGAWISSIRLRPPDHGRWTEEMVSRMNALLPGLNAGSSDASFHPYATAGREGNLLVDDFGSPAGILLPPDGAARFAPYLAKALKDAGLTLSRDGETWLRQHPAGQATSSRDPSSAAALPGHARGGATSEQRHAAAEGCTDISFSLEGYGLIRVVCGQAGRRDVWHNVYVSRQRFGFNGGRWARGQRPPEPVLRAIRERGITAFDETLEALERHERLEAPAPYGVDIRLDVAPLTQLAGRASTLERLSESASDDYLDPVVEQLIANGGLRADLIIDIAPELRGKARAIPGLLRTDGQSWLQAARHYYGPDVQVVEGSAPLDAWPETEGTSGYIELVSYALDYCVVDLDPEDDEELEHLCGCDRTPDPAVASGRRPRATTAPAGELEYLCGCDRRSDRAVASQHRPHAATSRHSPQATPSEQRPRAAQTGRAK